MRMSDPKFWDNLYPFRDPSILIHKGHLSDEIVCEMHLTDGVPAMDYEDDPDESYGPTAAMPTAPANPIAPKAPPAVKQGENSTVSDPGEKNPVGLDQGGSRDTPDSDKPQ